MPTVCFVDPLAGLRREGLDMAGDTHGQRKAA